MTEFNYHFAKNLAYLRKHNNLTLEQFSKEVGVSRSTLANYERGIRVPDLMTASKLATFFNCSLDDMVFNGMEIDIKKLKKIEKIDNAIESFKNNDSIIKTLESKKLKLEQFTKDVPQQIEEIEQLLEIIKSNEKKRDYK